MTHTTRTADPELRPRVVGRLAPSPTGHLHLGHARTFLLAWWSARAQGGDVVLRVEDLDGDRCTPELADAVRRDSDWLGLDWDDERLQSDGVDEIEVAITRLFDAGKAYACTCSRADVRAAQIAPQAGDREIPYPGTCRGRFASVAEAERKTGKPAGVRFVVPDGPVRVVDAFAPARSFDVAREAGDFLVTRRNGMPAYQLAVVVDDAQQGVTEVLRGDDLLPSTARQLLLQQVLGLTPPRWVHVPLVEDGTGRRLAKRANDVSLAELRSGGTDPRAIVAWAARSAGIDAADRVTPAEIAPTFSLDRVPRHSIRLDAAALSALRDARA